MQFVVKILVDIPDARYVWTKTRYYQYIKTNFVFHFQQEDLVVHKKTSVFENSKAPASAASTSATTASAVSDVELKLTVSYSRLGRF